MKIVLRTSAAVCAAVVFASCDTKGITVPPPPEEELTSIVPSSTSVTVMEETCASETTSFLQGSTVCAAVEYDVAEDVETSALVEWRTPAGALANSEQFLELDHGDGSRSETPKLTLEGTAPTGTWRVFLCQYSCSVASGGIRLDSASFTVTGSGPAAQAIDFTDAGDWVYGDGTFNLTAAATSELPVSFSSQTPGVCSVSGTQATILAAGTCTIRASQGGDGVNWAPAPDVDQDVTIAPRGITVTADPQQKTVGDADPALTYTHAPALIGSDAFSGALDRLDGETPGVYAIEQGTLTLGSNYEITYVGASLTIHELPADVSFEGFFLPIRMGAVTTTNAGAVVPVGFRIFVDGVQKTDNDGIDFTLAPAVGCPVDEEIVASQELEVDGESTLRYAGGNGLGGSYLMLWKTPGAGCYQLTLTYAGESLSALFRVK